MGFDGEFYERDGKRYDRITRVIGHFAPPELVAYKVKVGNRAANAAAKKAAQFGSMVDEAIRLDWNNPKNPKPSSEWSCAICAFEMWKRDFGVTSLSFPDTAFSDELMVAGTPDFVFGDMIVDLKCSSSVKTIYFAQLGAYWALTGKQAKDLAILRLDKNTGLYEFVKASSIGYSPADCYEFFLSSLFFYRHYNSVQRALKPKEVVSEYND